jgi:soluble lytic murein transglycosylase-like protein
MTDRGGQAEMDEFERRLRRFRKRRQLRRQRLFAASASVALIALALDAAFTLGAGTAAAGREAQPPSRSVVGRGLPTVADDTRTPLPCPVPRPLGHAFAGVSDAVGIEPALLVSVARAESGFDVGAASARGAVGLLQLMPETAKDLRVDPSRSVENLMGGARYLLSLIERFGSLQLALAAYNAGPAVVERYSGVPPYPETEQYVTRVTNARHLLSGCHL